MKTKNWFRIFGLATVISLTLASCNKEKDTDTNSAADNALAEQTFNDVNNIADEGSTGSVGSYKTLTSCATVTFDSAAGANPDTFTIDFGTVNCTGLDGRARRGKIIVVFTGRYADSASYHTITFDNFYVNDNKVEGSKTVTNMGTNSNGNIYFDIIVDGSIVLADGSGTITWTSTRSREWIAGSSTPLNPLDDVYLITGAASGTTAADNTFTVTITEALRIQLDCRWITDGKIEFIPEGRFARLIDYGDGTCDNAATVTIGTHTYNITLR